MSKSIDTVVTGGTGLIGRWLLAALTRHGRRVGALVRDADVRGAELLRFIDRIGGDSSRVVVIDGDVEGDVLVRRPDLAEVRDVYHLAARFAFGLSIDEARRVNVEGTQRLLSWATALPNLRRFVHVGGYRAQHMPDWLRQAAFPLTESVSRRLYTEAGAYEASKLESVLLVRDVARRGAAPVTIVHPSSVIGDAKTGETTQSTGLGELVEQLWRGKLMALPGTARTNVPVITVDALAELMCTVVERAETVGDELCFLDPKTPPLPELVSLLAGHLGVAKPNRLIPISLVRRLPKFITKTDPEALTFLTEDQYDTRSAEEHARAVGFVLPPLGPAIEKWAAHLVATRFLHDDPPSAELAPRFVSALGSRTFVLGDPTDARVVLLHGLPWNGDSCRPVAEGLGGSAALIDLPGLGRSSSVRQSRVPSGDASPEVAWLREVLAQRKTKMVLVGHSMGAGIAVEFAHKYPELIAQLVLVSPAFLQGRAPFFLRQPWLLGSAFRFGSKQFLQNQILPRASMRPPVGSPPASTHLNQAVDSAHDALQRPGVALATARALTAASHIARRRRQADALSQLRGTPVLLIQGQRDPLVSTPEHVQLHVVKESGHNPHVEAPADVANAIRSFLRQASAQRPVDASGRRISRVSP